MLQNLWSHRGLLARISSMVIMEIWIITKGQRVTERILTGLVSKLEV